MSNANMIIGSSPLRTGERIATVKTATVRVACIPANTKGSFLMVVDTTLLEANDCYLFPLCDHNPSRVLKAPTPAKPACILARKGRAADSDVLHILVHSG